MDTTKFYYYQKHILESVTLPKSLATKIYQRLKETWVERESEIDRLKKDKADLLALVMYSQIPNTGDTQAGYIKRVEKVFAGIKERAIDDSASR